MMGWSETLSYAPQCCLLLLYTTLRGSYHPGGNSYAHTHTYSALHMATQWAEAQLNAHWCLCVLAQCWLEEEISHLVASKPLTSLPSCITIALQTHSHATLPSIVHCFKLHYEATAYLQWDNLWEVSHIPHICQGHLFKTILSGVE